MTCWPQPTSEARAAAGSPPPPSRVGPAPPLLAPAARPRRVPPRLPPRPPAAPNHPRRCWASILPSGRIRAVRRRARGEESRSKVRCGLPSASSASVPLAIELRDLAVHRVAVGQVVSDRAVGLLERERREALNERLRSLAAPEPVHEGGESDPRPCQEQRPRGVPYHILDHATNLADRSPESEQGRGKPRGPRCAEEQGRLCIHAFPSIHRSEGARSARPTRPRTPLPRCSTEEVP